MALEPHQELAVADSRVPVISIVIPCRGHALELRGCLEALGHQEGQLVFEVLVVDSAFDPQVELVAGAFPDVQLLRSRQLLSAGGARNLGAKHAAAPILGFIDADCIPHPGWAQAAVSAIRAGAVLVGGPVLDAMPWHLIASSDNRLQFADFPAGRPPGLIEYCPGAHLAVSRNAYDRVGGFSDTILYSQDVIFTSRISALWPQQARYSPQLIVRHHGRRHWSDFLEHQRTFGFARSEFRVRMNRTLAWLAERPHLAWIVVLRRLLYISARVLQWNLLDLPRFLLEVPILAAGLIAWTQGFYAGMRAQPASRP